MQKRLRDRATLAAGEACGIKSVATPIFTMPKAMKVMKKAKKATEPAPRNDQTRRTGGH